MKLRFEVDQAESFRRGIDAPKSIVTIEIDPAKIQAIERHAIADRLDGIDVCKLFERDGKFLKCFDQDKAVLNIHEPARIITNTPDYAGLMEAIRAEDAELGRGNNTSKGYFGGGDSRLKSPRQFQPRRLENAHAQGAATNRMIQRGPRTRLRVAFDDGAIIEERQAADTFALALQRMGLDRIATLGITVRTLPLVGNTKSDQYGQRDVNGKYICTHSSTEEKKETLEQVAKKLGLVIKVDVI